MKEFQVNGRTFSGYLAVPEGGSGPGVLLLHAWWGLTEPFRHICDRLAQAGFVALALDLYQGKTATTIEEAGKLGGALDRDYERVRDDIAAAVQFLRQHNATPQTDDHSKIAIIGFSLGGAYALDASVNLAEEVAAVVIFYASYAGPDFRKAKAAYLCHFAEHDPYESPESVAETEQALRTAGRSATFYTYPGTKHWFFEENRPEYDAGAAQLAWERTVEFLHQRLD